MPAKCMDMRAWSTRRWKDMHMWSVSRWMDMHDMYGDAYMERLAPGGHGAHGNREPCVCGTPGAAWMTCMEVQVWSAWRWVGVRAGTCMWNNCCMDMHDMHMEPHVWISWRQALKGRIYMLIWSGVPAFRASPTPTDAMGLRVS